MKHSVLLAIFCTWLYAGGSGAIAHEQTPQNPLLASNQAAQTMKVPSSGSDSVGPGKSAVAPIASHWPVELMGAFLILAIATRRSGNSHD